MAKPQYGAAHQRRRADWKLELTRTGGRQCACRGQCRKHRGRCREWITADSDWHLCHGVPVKRGGTGEDSEPGCPSCNQTEGALLRASRTPPASEDWW